MSSLFKPKFFWKNLKNWYHFHIDDRLIVYNFNYVEAKLNLNWNTLFLFEMKEYLFEKKTCKEHMTLYNL